MIEFSVPNDVWNRIVRNNGPEHDQEYICVQCFADKCCEFVEGLEFYKLLVEVGRESLKGGDYEGAGAVLAISNRRPTREEVESAIKEMVASGVLKVRPEEAH